MYFSFEGKIAYKDDKANIVAIEVGPIAYELFVARSEDFTLNETKKVFAYEVFGENDHYLVGFPSLMEKEAFLSLIAVKGIGPKTALGALGATKPEDLFKAISASNTAFLKKLPGIGPKAAAQIILDLKGKLEDSALKNGGTPKQFDEVAEALRTLGFKKKDIDDTLSTINEPNLTNEELLRHALRKLNGKGKQR